MRKIASLLAATVTELVHAPTAYPNGETLYRALRYGQPVSTEQVGRPGRPAIDMDEFLPCNTIAMARHPRPTTRDERIGRARWRNLTTELAIRTP